MSTNINLFEWATRNKIRFPSSKGDISTEQLWEVPLRSNDSFNLNEIAKGINKALKDNEENFVSTEPTVAATKAARALDLVKLVIETKIGDEATAKKRAENKARKQVLMAALVEKQEGKVAKMSEAELKRQIEELDED